MSNKIVPVKSTSGTSRLVRAVFEPGMLLLHDDLQRLNTYTRELSRLMFKSLFGCGVICGLDVQAIPNDGTLEITVRAGVALGCSGDPVDVPTKQTLVLDENCEQIGKGPFWVVLCATVKRCAPRSAVCNDDDESHSECTQEKDGFEIRVLRERPECACGCPEPKENEKPTKVTDCKCVNPDLLDCFKKHYDGECECHCDESSDCGCKCILLARMERIIIENEIKWFVDHRVRRFIRPLLMRDPRVPQATAEDDNGDEVQGEEVTTEQATARLTKVKEESRQKEAEKKSAKKREQKA